MQKVDFQYTNSKSSWDDRVAEYFRRQRVGKVNAPAFHQALDRARPLSSGGVPPLKARVAARIAARDAARKARKGVDRAEE